MKKKEAAGVAVYSVVKIVVIILVIMVVYRLGSMAYSYGERIFGEPPMESAPGTDIVITVGSEDSVRDIAENLKSAGLIRDAGLFVLQERLAGSLIPYFSIKSCLTATIFPMGEATLEGTAIVLPEIVVSSQLSAAWYFLVRGI